MSINTLSNELMGIKVLQCTIQIKVYYFYSGKGLRPSLVLNCNLRFSWKGKCFITLNSMLLFLTASRRPKITMKTNIFVVTHLPAPFFTCFFLTGLYVVLSF